jgi:hypothetical protein
MLSLLTYFFVTISSLDSLVDFFKVWGFLLLPSSCLFLLELPLLLARFFTTAL